MTERKMAIDNIIRELVSIAVEHNYDYINTNNNKHAVLFSSDDKRHTLGIEVTEEYIRVEALFEDFDFKVSLGQPDAFEKYEKFIIGVTNGTENS